MLPVEISVSRFPEVTGTAPLSPHPARVAVDRDAASLLTVEAVAELQALPIARHGPVVTIAMTQPANVALLAYLAELTGLRVRPVATTARAIRQALPRVYAPSARLPGGPQPTLRLGELLVADRLISEAQLEQAVTEQLRTGERLGQVLIHLGLINSRALALTLARQLGLPFCDLAAEPPPAELVRALPRAVALDSEAVPVRREGTQLRVAFADPLDRVARLQVDRALGKPSAPAIADPALIARVLASTFADDRLSV